MTIRFKILSISLALLVIFGVVVGVSAILQRQVTAQIGGITEYHGPLTALIADFDVVTFEYELVPLRLLRLPQIDQDNVANEQARARSLAIKMTDDFRAANAVIDKAIADDRLSFDNRLTFARLKGSVGFLERKLGPFIDTGQNVMQAIIDGRRDEARALTLEFRNYEEAFGPDTAAVRREIVALTSAATEAVYQKQAAIQFLSFGLFGIAACLGLGIGAVVSGGVIRTLRRVLEGTRAVEAGQLTVSIPIHTNDEIGELASAFNRMVIELRAKERIKDTFGKYVDPRIVAGLLEAKTGDAEADHAERRTVTVFFSDIQGFTSISEQLTATAMVNLLNHYFTAATNCIRASNGIVDKYIGDAIMAFWSPPFSPGDSHAESACLAALAQQEAIEDLKKDLPNIVGLRRNPPNLIVRMGIATGEVVVGTIGSSVSKSFTVIGDTVNLASRLEGVNKTYHTRLIISEETLRLAQNAVEARELDLITVVGKTEPVRIYELLCRHGQLMPAAAECYEEFAAALASYRAQRWDEAERQFRHCLAMKTDDGPSEIFLERIETLRRDPPAADWDGVWRFTHK